MEFNYQDMIDRGFKRQNSHDPIFLKQYGFDWFIVTYKLSKTLHLDWDCNTRKVELIRTDKSGSRIKARGAFAESLEDIDGIIAFFTDK